MLAETPPSPPRPADSLLAACDHLKKIPPLQAAFFQGGGGGGNLPVFALASANPLTGTPHAA
jgi:hypothetical protein